MSNTPLSTPVRQAKLGISSTKSLPLANEFKKLLAEQHQRLWIKHQQDLDLIDDIRSYVKARLSIERDYTTALNKLGKQHANHIAKKFTLMSQCDPPPATQTSGASQSSSLANQRDSNQDSNNNSNRLISAGGTSNSNQQDLNSDSRLQKRLANKNGLEEPDKPCSLYKVWSEHINRLQLTSKNRNEQFEQLIMIVDKLKDIRSHKANIGKKCLDTHLKRIHEDILVSMVEIEKTRKLYYEDESQAKKARENEERIKKKRSGLLTKFTDLQAKKEKTSAQREANDIQSTQARNDYIMALAAGNAHLQHYHQRDLNDFIHLIDDGVLDHCKIFMATLSECDINSLKDALTHAQYWSKMINLTGSQKTNSIFLDCEQSACLRTNSGLAFEPCNNDPIQCISLEHNADYALQHEIDKWFTWFKKECRNLSQLMHMLDTCQHAFSEGKKSIELNGQTIEDLEPKIIELKQQIRKSEAAKLKAQARLKVIKEGGMQIEEWSTVESEIRADMARAQEELEARRLKEAAALVDNPNEESSDGDGVRIEDDKHHATQAYMFEDQVRLQVSKESDDSEAGQSVNHLASVSRSNSNLIQKQQNAMTGYSALTDPSLVWQDDYSSAWGSTQGGGAMQAPTSAGGLPDAFTPVDLNKSINRDDSSQVAAATATGGNLHDRDVNASGTNSYDLLGTSQHPSGQSGNHNQMGASMTVQSSSPLSAIVDGNQSSPSPYPGMVGEAYKSDYECDYNTGGHHLRSATSSAEPFNQHHHHQQQQQQQSATDPYGLQMGEKETSGAHFGDQVGEDKFDERFEDANDAFEMLHKEVIALYSFDKTNEDDLAFNESDILRVIEVSDANWVKARNSTTGEEGFVPTSYIRVHEIDGDHSEPQQEQPSMSNNQVPKKEAIHYGADAATGGWSLDSASQQQGPDSIPPDGPSYCRAIYDYEPELNTFEEDGLPHLSLVQGEVMRIIDQGEDDGWWLVEKESTGTRGHVPSMLVEEMEPGEEAENNGLDGGNNGDENDDEGEASEYSNGANSDDYVKAMPNFEPPKLELDQDEAQAGFSNNEQEAQEESTVRVEVDKSDKFAKSEAVGANVQKTGSSLIPISFIISEPTPEVESRRITDSVEEPTPKGEAESEEVGESVNAQATNTGHQQPPAGASYSVVNETFVLEQPPRRPEPQHCTADNENSMVEDASVKSQQTNDLSSKTPDGNYEPLSEVDSVDMPAPPSVVIESFYHENDKEEDYGCNSTDYIEPDGNQADDGQDGNNNNNNNSSSEIDSYRYVPQKEFKHTGNVDVSPILRLRAEEFSKQIIAEAIMMMPGTCLGPSTSSPVEPLASSSSTSPDDD